VKKEEAIKKLRENMDKIKGFGVKRIGIFGSVVRGEAKEGSDIDFVVGFEKGKATFKNVCRLIDFLEELFGKEVDILTPDGIESIRIKHVREDIKREVEYV
jgi:predicted nucleotidyltransferase